MAFRHGRHTGPGTAGVPGRGEVLLLGAASGWGAPDHGAADGPRCLHQPQMQAALRQRGVMARWAPLITAPPAPAGVPPLEQACPVTAEFCAKLADAVAAACQAGRFFITLGGDHSCAIGTWTGAARALQPGRPGLIWLDAHMDAHTPRSSPSGALYGMPLACLLGEGPEALTGLGGLDGQGPKLDPARVCLIGVHSFEPEEAALLDRHGVRVFMRDEVRRRGLVRVLDEALAIVTQGSAGFGLSIDLDVVDPQDAPGVSLPVSGGLGGRELTDALRPLRRHPALVGAEIAEFNPARDHDGRTARLVLDLVAAIAGRGRRASHYLRRRYA